jgi:hypothetical protein
MSEQLRAGPATRRTAGRGFGHAEESGYRAMEPPKRRGPSSQSYPQQMQANANNPRSMSGEERDRCLARDARERMAQQLPAPIGSQYNTMNPGFISVMQRDYTVSLLLVCCERTIADARSSRRLLQI